METLIEKLALGKTVSDDIIKEELHDICERVHAGCNNDCPVFRLNGGKIPAPENPDEHSYGCTCFKNGKAMLEFIRSKNFTVGQELTFDVYGTTLAGEFIEMLNDTTVKIKVTFDETGATEIGATSNVSKSFLKK